MEISIKSLVFQHMKRKNNYDRANADFHNIANGRRLDHRSAEIVPSSTANDLAKLCFSRTIE